MADGGAAMSFRPTHTVPERGLPTFLRPDVRVILI